MEREAAPQKETLPKRENLPKENKKEKGFALLWRDLKGMIPVLLMLILVFTLMQVFFHTVCPMQIVCGIPCPGCGLTRAGVLLLQGKVAESFRMHPFLMGWVLLAADFFWHRYIRGTKAGEFPVLLTVIIAGMVILYIYRMKVYFPYMEPMKPRGGGLYSLFAGIMKK
ncbi:MAG: DUF2752 domain-containing protein [Lachnospiraceae bacterium]|nr:DUF2752 domain-containing protein [Lachnospiraceae bacterium]